MADIKNNLNEWFGIDPKKRALKLAEEVNELIEAIEKGDLTDIDEEINDVSLVLYHILTIYGKEWRVSVTNAYNKAHIRRTDPEYMRKHKHIKMCQFCPNFQRYKDEISQGVCKRDNAKRAASSKCSYTDEDKNKK